MFTIQRERLGEGNMPAIVPSLKGHRASNGTERGFLDFIIGRSVDGHAVFYAVLRCPVLQFFEGIQSDLIGMKKTGITDEKLLGAAVKFECHVGWLRDGIG